MKINIYYASTQLQYYALQRDGIDLTSFQAVKGYSSYNFTQYWQRYTNCCVGEYDLLLLLNFNKSNCNCSRSPTSCPTITTNLTDCSIDQTCPTILTGCSINQTWIKDCNNSFSDFIAYPQSVPSTYFTFQMMIYLALSCLLYFLLLLLPYLLFVNYDGFYHKCKEVNENPDRGADFQFKRFVNIFLVWSMAGVSTGILAFDAILELYVIADYVMGGYSGRKRTLYWVLFWIANGGVILVCIFYAIFVCVTVCIKGKHDFPVTNIIRILLCCCYEVNSQDSKRSNSAFQFFFALPILLFIQVLAIHGIFVFLALIASPVHVISTIIAYGTGAASPVHVISTIIAYGTGAALIVVMLALFMSYLLLLPMVLELH